MLKSDTTHWEKVVGKQIDNVDALRSVIEFLRSPEAHTEWPFLFVSENKDDLEELKKALEHFAEFDNVLMLGTGGSSLGGQMLYELAKKKKTVLHFLDNVDPCTFDDKINQMDLRKTGVVVISKSGHTSETLCQFMCLLSQYKKHLGNNFSNHFLVITEPGARPMRTIAEQYSLPCFDHDPKIGGRFSVLSNVGMSAGILGGVNAEKVRLGAARVLKHVLNEKSLEKIPSVQSALLSYGLHKSGHTVSVVMPYSDRLRPLSKWFVQLWAESLGKKDQGNTPIHALGTVDQHSQLQLFLDGPRDKAFTIIATDTRSKGLKIEDSFMDVQELGYFSNTSMGDLLYAHQEATIVTLRHNNCPTRVLRMDILDEESLGALIMTFMLETIFMATLMGINAFDQPAVEEGKVRMKEFMKRLKDDHQAAIA